MDSQLVSCPACNRKVRARDINAHLDDKCSTHAAIHNSSSEEFSRSAGSSRRKATAPNVALAPIFATAKSTPLVHTPNIYTENHDAPHATTSHSKRPIDYGSPTPVPKRKKTLYSSENVPLAEKLRPTQLSDFIGQTHLMEPGSLLSTMFQTNATWSIILWGPPGCGKTTLAKLIAEQSGAILRELSGTASGVNEVKTVVEEAKKNRSLLGRRTILFLDEIHRFNKAQQDVFLPFVEQGVVQLIGATTENPSFRLTGALMSRCRVLRLESLSDQQMFKLLKQSVEKIQLASSEVDDTHPLESSTTRFALESRLVSRIVSMASGDARKALSLLEVGLRSPKDAPEEQVMEALKQSLITSYDRTGEDHYDMISALHKSVRGGDGSAAMYWLARMLTAGEDPLFVARRMVVCASEDIGLADSHALPLAMATLQACQVIGMPECRINLAHLVAYLAEAPKSTRAYEAYKRAEVAAKETSMAPVPMQIRNAPTALMEEMGYGKNYHYNPDYCHPVHNEYMPKEIAGNKFLLKNGDLSGKVWDEQALVEWEMAENEGQSWEGRA